MDDGVLVSNEPLVEYSTVDVAKKNNTLSVAVAQAGQILSTFCLWRSREDERPRRRQSRQPARVLCLMLFQEKQN